MNLDNDLDVIRAIKTSVINGTRTPLITILIKAFNDDDVVKCEKLATRFEGYYRALLAE